MTLKAEPVAWYHVPYPNSGISPMVSLSQQHEPSMYGAVVPLYLVPPQRKPLTEEEERNFCPRCGKRTRDIHTCTPPQAEPEGDALTAAYMLGRHDGKRKPLTDEEIRQIALDTPIGGTNFARAIERAHGIGD